MRALWLISALALSAPSTVASGDDCFQMSDPEGDATVRRTDPGNDGALHPDGVVPDVLSVSVCGWEPFNPAADPYTGTTVSGDDAEIFRLDIVFKGLVNPPGSVLGGTPTPFKFGPSPVVGFLDIDIDHHDSGGELGTAATARYLANVARFGRLPESSAGERAARSRADLDGNFYTSPQYERSGADFALVLCGCDEPTIVSEGGDLDGKFEAGETWVIRGRLFERTRGYLEASAAYGGSAPGLYDPFVNVRFSHSTDTDRTTVTLVWSLTMRGEAELRGETEQAIDLNVANHTSVIESVQDIIDGADDGGFGGPGWVLVQRWEGRDADEYLDPSDWEITGLFGMPYLSLAEGTYAWTDTIGDEYEGDCDGDGYANAADESLVRATVYAKDGTSEDADGVRNGRWTLVNPGWNFTVYDLDGDMVVDNLDVAVLRSLGDFNWDGRVNTQDFIAFLNAWVAGSSTADFNLDGRLDTLDFVAFLNAWVAG